MFEIIYELGSILAQFVIGIVVFFGLVILVMLPYEFIFPKGKDKEPEIIEIEDDIVEAEEEKESEEESLTMIREEKINNRINLRKMRENIKNYKNFKYK